MDTFNIVLQYIIAIIGFSIIVLVHELGHFVFALITRMHVLEFFIGFGPKILKFKSKKSGTQYGISAIPLGGYNKILGMDRSEKIPEGMKDRAFYVKPFWKKFLVISGGGIFNIILTIILIMIFLSMGVYVANNTIDYIQPDSPAEISGFKINDEVIALNGEPIETWEDFSRLTKEHPGEIVTYTLLRDEVKIDILAKLNSVNNEGFLGVSPQAEKVKLGILQIIKQSFTMTWDITVSYVKLFGMLFSGQIPFSEARPASPIGVVSIFQQSVAMGYQNFILFVGLVSLLIAFGNFLPILPVDGGHILIIIIEAIIRRPVPRKFVEVYNTIGIVFIVSLLLIGLIFDIITPFRLPSM